MNRSKVSLSPVFFLLAEWNMSSACLVPAGACDTLLCKVGGQMRICNFKLFVQL